MSIDISTVQSEKKCYLCGRSGCDDLDSLFPAVEEHFDERIRLLEERLEEHTSEVRAESAGILKLLKAAEESCWDFSIRTIKTDIKVFKKKIPHLDEILAWWEKERKHKDEWTIRIMIDRIESFQTGQAGWHVNVVRQDLNKASKSRGP